jgi:hypothetical protein
MGGGMLGKREGGPMNDYGYYENKRRANDANVIKINMMGDDMNQFQQNS